MVDTVIWHVLFQLSRQSLCAPFCTRDPYEGNSTVHLENAEKESSRVQVGKSGEETIVATVFV